MSHTYRRVAEHRNEPGMILRASKKLPILAWTIAIVEAIKSQKRTD